jgi:hypothetical protein
VDTQHLDDALGVFAATAPEFGRHGLSNHGPMAAEVLEHMGRDDAIGPWVAAYRARLAPSPPPGAPLSEWEWPRALGERERFPEWLALFEKEMADRPVTAVVGEWVPRLVPGTVAAAMHGLLRTAHALRSLGVVDNATRRLEVATGLAYWACTYQELPGPPLLIGHQGVDDALAGLPYLPEETPTEALITDQVAHVADISEEFEQSVASLGHSGDALTLLDALASGGARAYLRNAATGNPIALIHAITGPLAFELVLSWLPAEDREAGLGYVWQAVASLHVAYDVDRHAPEAGEGGAVPVDDLFERAVASRDEHAIKLTEAALRSYARTGDEQLLRAAADASVRLAGS